MVPGPRTDCKRPSPGVRGGLAFENMMSDAGATTMGAAHTLRQAEATPLADRLGALRHKYFVGRATELELFRAALLGYERPFALLYIHGPGGVGKTLLVRELARLSSQAGATVVTLDGRDLELSPTGFLRGL